MKALLAAAFVFGTLASPAAAANIEFWYGSTGTNGTAIEKACEAFNRSQSGHTIKCVSQGSNEATMQKAIAAVRARQHPVLIQFFDAGTLDLMLSGVVEPVAQLLPNVDWNDYIQGARSYYETSKGQLFSQPYNASTLLFYGNKELLAKAGIPALPETYEGVVEASRKLKAAGVDCPFATDAHPWRVLEQFSARHGAAIASKGNGYGGLDAEYVFNKGLTATHLTNLAEWRKEGLLRLDADTKAGKFPDAFTAAECAMVENSSAFYGAAFKALGDKLLVGMAPVYSGQKRYNTLVGGGSLWIMKERDPQEVEGAKAFLDFVRKPEQQIELTRITGNLPVTKDVMQAMKEKGLLADPAFGAVEPGINSMDQPSSENSRGIRLGFYVQFRDVFKEEMQKVFAGQQTVQVALDNAKTRGDQLLRRFEQTYKGVQLP
jgi:sn-glycerol 3-phosphate transport system substrate-binding protein